jgi:DegV family protein with EDD domain
MKPIAIVTDSTAVITDNILNKYSFLYTLPLQIIFEDDVYNDGDITQEEFFNLIDKYPDLPTTSQPLVGFTIELLEQLLKEYEKVIFITISSKISGTYQTTLAAAKQIDGERITVFDSLLTATVQKKMVMEACKCVENGDDVEKIVTVLSDMRKKHQVYLIVDDLKYLERTGRVNSTVASIGTILKIKPIVRFENGAIVTDSKVRTMKKAMSYMISKLDELKVKDNTHILIAHAKGMDYAKKMEQLIKDEYPTCSVSICELSPVISVHTGPQTLGVSWVNGY